MKRPQTLTAVMAASLTLAFAAPASAQAPMGGAGMQHGMHGPMQHGMNGGMAGGAGGMGPGMMMQGMGMGGHGPVRGPMAGAMANADSAFHDDMGLVHDMLQGHDTIKRNVSNLPDGIRTATESDDPQIARAIKAHVASMEKRLGEGREFNLFSPTIPVLFQNRDKIRTEVRMTDKGAIVTQTSADARVVAALQAHAIEVSELARDGMAAMMRSARAGMGAGQAQR